MPISSALKPFPKRIGVGGFAFTAAERGYLEEVMQGDVLTYGPLSERFEQRFAQLHEVEHAVLCNSGTSALHVALAALREVRGWKRETEIILPAITFVATLNMVLEVGLTPVVVDVDAKTYNMDPAQLRRAVTSKTGAVMPVHLFGQPCQMTEIMAIVRQHQLAVVEDSAETMFAKFNGQSVGSFGEFGCFSTYIAHLLITGVGGIITTRDAKLAALARSLCNHGRDPRYLSANMQQRDDAQLSLEDLQARFRFVRHGFSYRMTELEAALGLGQLDQIEQLLQRRRANAAFLTRQLQPLTNVLQLPEVHPQAEHSFMMYPIVLKNDRHSKWDLMHFLEAHNIDTREMLPLTNQPVYSGRVRFGDLPVAERINRGGFYIGCHPYLNEEELAFQVAVLLAYFSKGKAS